MTNTANYKTLGELPVIKSWAELYRMHSDIDSVEMCLVMSELWRVAADSGDVALVSNLLANQNSPSGACYAMDSAGIPVPMNIIFKLAR